MSKTFIERIRTTAQENGWSDPSTRRATPSRTTRMEKDGYEIYFLSTHEFELTIRDPKTMNRNAVMTYESSNGVSPSLIALVRHIIRNAEKIASNYTEEENGTN